jgi:mannose-6-phosphate isomerase-like protein (cupin superfamily)
MAEATRYRCGSEEQMGSTTEAVRTATSAGPAWWFLDCLLVELSSGRDRPVVAEAILPTGASPPLHVHRDLDDSFYVLDGQIVVCCGDETGLATAGTWVPFPRRVPHTFRVMAAPARVLFVHGDDSFMRMAREIGEPAAAVALPPPNGGPGIDELSRVLAPHGITNIGPSMTEAEALAFLSST